jgi:hypothetical protein
MGRIDNNGKVSSHQLTEDLNTGNAMEHTRLTSKGEEFAIVGTRGLGQIGVTRCNFALRKSLVAPRTDAQVSLW